MALMGQREQPMRDLSTTPSSQVRSMRAQGLSNNQIIQSLQREGYDTQRIVDAMNQAEMQSAGPPPMPEMPKTRPAVQDIQPQPIYEEPPMEEMPSFSESPSYQAPAVDPQIEEIAEAIIDEKWNELVKHVNKIVQWKQEMEGSMRAMEARFNDLKQSFDALQQGLVHKVDEYDRNIMTVGADMKAMEQVFQKIIPELTNNVNELSRITRKQKKS